MPQRMAQPAAKGEMPKAARARATASVAPEALPSKNGSAKGLRNSPWAMAPASPSKAPAAKAPRVRGARMSQTICAATGSSSMCHTDSSPELPTPSPITASTTDATTSATATHAARNPARVRRVGKAAALLWLMAERFSPPGSAPECARLRPCAALAAPKHRTRPGQTRKWHHASPLAWPPSPGAAPHRQNPGHQS